MTELVAAYRLQLNSRFGFAEAQKILPYLKSLGISHLYLSPIWQARAGSTHGYDVVDPAMISSDLGGEDRFYELAQSDFGIILDVVPNHMAVDATNPYWNDEQLREQFFDIDTATGFHRRFFDVDDLVGVRMEDPEVFASTHRKIKELLSSNLVDGLRIDHIDGLADPAKYLERLALLGARYLWVEKILASDEDLRPWPVNGTTGYDFLNELTALFVEPSSEAAMTEMSGELRDFGDIAFEAKLEQVVDTFTPEVTRLRSLVDAPEMEVALASLPVYRTYVIPDRDIDDADLSIITHLPEPIRSVFTHGSETTKEFIIRFQQTTAAVMAKGEEDTALYRYVRLLALNEVGGDPRRFGLSVQEFHDANNDRSRRFPQTIVCSQTHDTKRSGDVRARLVALSHRVDDWVTSVGRWHELNSKWRVDDAPDWTEELFIYQTLIGGWPIGMDRLGPYLLKALREAKRNTNWIEPDETWEGRVIEFCARLCSDQEFLGAFVPFADQIGLLGERIALAQLVLRLSSPGVPDIYQGDESWNLSFVDPDNRRPIDWEKAQKTLAGLLSVSPQVQRSDAKLFVTKTMLELRHRRDEEFRGPYKPLPADTTTCAYRRGADVVVAVALRDQPISFELPYGTWSNVLGPIKNCYSPTPVACFERVSD